MRDILGDIGGWTEPFALATVVRTWSSAPRPPGAAIAVSSAGDVVGSVSGGCVEADVYALCESVLSGGEPVLAHYGVSDDEAMGVGLTCGGTIEVFVARVDPRHDQISLVADRVDARSPAATLTVLTGSAAGSCLVLADGDLNGTSGDDRLDVALHEAAAGLLESGTNRVLKFGDHGEARMEHVSVFVESFAPPPSMLIYGAIDFSSALARIGKFLGFHVTVCDARPVFTTRARFPDADKLVVAWPHEHLAAHVVDPRTAICVLTHDPKFDVPLLLEALRGRAGYIGVMGSRLTQTDRLARLAELGVADSELRRMSAPIGLDLGGRTPEETAISIAAEIVADRWGGTGTRLTDIEAPIHRDLLERATGSHLATPAHAAG